MSKKNFRTIDDKEDSDFLKSGQFVEIISYDKNSSIPKNKSWIITEYDNINDTAKIVSLSGKKSCRIESWKLSPIKFMLNEHDTQSLVGGFKNIDTDEE